MAWALSLGTFSSVLGGEKILGWLPGPVMHILNTSKVDCMVQAPISQEEAGEHSALCCSDVLCYLRVSLFGQTARHWGRQMKHKGAESHTHFLPVSKEREKYKWTREKEFLKVFTNKTKTKKWFKIYIFKKRISFFLVREGGLVARQQTRQWWAIKVEVMSVWNSCHNREPANKLLP